MFVFIFLVSFTFSLCKISCCIWVYERIRSSKSRVIFLMSIEKQLKSSKMVTVQMGLITRQLLRKKLWSYIFCWAGELKKLLSAETGLQPGEQKIIFRGKERENGSYLDACGVKNKSKIVLMESPSSREKRYIEMRKNAKIQSTNIAIKDVSMEVNKLAEQVGKQHKSKRKKLTKYWIVNYNQW